MKTLTRLVLASCVLTTVSAYGATLDDAIEAAITSVESQVVQLRYFGDAGDTLGASAAPVTGYDLGGGWVITSDYGLAETPAAIVVRRAEGSQQRLVVAGRDCSRQLVLLRTEEPTSPRPTIAPSRATRVGETAIALGKVYDAKQASAHAGIVSAVNRLGGRTIQTDAAVSPANYGGPLIALDGTLLGILTPLSPPGQSGVGLYDSGVGFAVPPSRIAGRLERLARGEEIHAGWLGIAFSENNPLETPPVVAKTIDDGPAARAGLKNGDRIVALNGRPTPTLWTLRRVLSGLDAGTTIEASITSIDGESSVVSIKLAKRPFNKLQEAASDVSPDGLPNKKPDGP